MWQWDLDKQFVMIDPPVLAKVLLSVCRSNLKESTEEK